MTVMTRLLRLWLGVAVAAAVAAAVPQGAVGGAASHPLAVPVAARLLASFHGATIDNAKVGHDCDWPGINDYADMPSSSPPDCVAKCTMESVCTHFVFQPSPDGSGWCYLKAGPVTAEEATLRWQDTEAYTCGLLPERLALTLPSVASHEVDDDDDDDVVVTAPTPSPATNPAGFHGATLGNAMVGHNCDWPGINDYADMPADTPSDCVLLCNTYQACTHFVYMITEGSIGWCHLKAGPVTAQEATLWSPSNTVYTCGLLLERLAPTPPPVSPIEVDDDDDDMTVSTSTPSPTATPSQTPPLDDPSNASPTMTPSPNDPSEDQGYRATCNVHSEDCDNTKAAIASRYLNRRCLPPVGSGLLVMSAAALDDAFAAIERYNCCARDEDRAKLLSVARLLVLIDTCAALDGAPLPTQAVTAGPTNSTAVEVPQNAPEVPAVDMTVSALGTLGVLSGDVAVGQTVRERSNRRQVQLGARNSVVLDVTNDDQPHHSGTSCCQDNFKYANQGCCAGWCWHVADILPFFDLKACCTEILTPFEPTCSL